MTPAGPNCVGWDAHAHQNRTGCPLGRPWQCPIPWAGMPNPMGWDARCWDALGMQSHTQLRRSPRCPQFLPCAALSGKTITWLAA